MTENLQEVLRRIREEALKKRIAASGDKADSTVALTARITLQIYERMAQAHQYGITCDELEVDLNHRHQTVSSRLNKLSKDKQIRDSGERRKTRSNRTAIVWVTAPVFEEYYAKLI